MFAPAISSLRGTGTGAPRRTLLRSIAFAELRAAKILSSCLRQSGCSRNRRMSLTGRSMMASSTSIPARSLPIAP